MYMVLDGWHGDSLQQANYGLQRPQDRAALLLRQGVMRPGRLMPGGDDTRLSHMGVSVS